MATPDVDEIYRTRHLQELETILGVVFKNRVNLVSSLTRRSYTNENKVPWENNERLEFLGDSVLQLAVSEQLYLKRKTDEGDLTERRKEEVNRDALSRELKELCIEKYLILGKGEGEKLAALGPEFFHNILEAIIGAIFLEENGYEKARQFINKMEEMHEK